MKIPTTPLYLYGGAAALGLGLIWWATRAGNAAKLAQGTVRVAGEVTSGTIKGLGQVVGIPDTDKTQCQKDMEAGNYWAASFSCPAGDYISGMAGKAKAAVFGSTSVSTAKSADAAILEGLQDPSYYNIYP